MLLYIKQKLLFKTSRWLFRNLSILWLSLSITQPALASLVEPDLWENTIQLGGSANTGNNPSTMVLGKFTSDLDINYPNHPLGYGFAVEAKRGTARGIETARLFRTHLEGRYLFSPRTYLFNKLNYVYNAYDTYDIVVRESFGLGHIFLQDERQKLTLELGPGGTHQRIAGPETWQNQFILHGEGLYQYKISKTARFSQEVIVDYGHLNTYTRSVTALTTAILEHIDLRVSFAVDHNSTIPPLSSNTKKTDTATDITFLYRF